MGHKYKFKSLVGAEGIGPKAFGVIDAAHFFIISLTLLFRRNQHNRTLVPYAFLTVSLAEMARSEVEICLLPLCFHRLRREPPQCLIGRTLRAQADSFNTCDQLRNANRLGENGRPWIWTPDLPSPFVTRPSERQPVFGAMSDRIQYI